MKKLTILSAICLLILTFSLMGCENIDYNTTYNSQTVWDQTKNKEAEDIFTIENINIAKLVVVENLKLTVKRKFEGDKITIDFSLDELKVTFSQQASGLFDIVLSFVKDLNLTMDDIKAIVNNISEVKGQIVLTKDKTQIDYNINVKINYDSPKYDSTQTGSVTISPDIDYSDTIKRSMDMLTSHFTTIITPTKGKKAEINASYINKIAKSAVDYYEANDPNKGTAGYIPLNRQIKNILGVSYSQILTTKTKITNSKSSCKVKDNFINKMDLSLLNVQLLYNKAQLIEVATKALNLLSPENAKYIKILSGYLEDINKDSCITVDKINLKSTYTLM